MRIKALARAAALLLALALAGPAFADESLGALSPREVFVGDEAIFSYIDENLHFYRLFGELEPGAAFEVPRELIPADTADISIKGARLTPLQGRENAALCEITFVPWKTGDVSIPEIAFTPDGALRSRAVTVKVASLASRSEATSLMPNRPPILPPGTLYLLYALVLIAAATCFAACLAVRRLLELRKRHKRIPIKKISREFKKLIKEQRLRIAENQPGWYVDFSAIVRLFFYRMTGSKSFLAATARDIASLLEEASSSCTEEEAAAAKRLIAALFQIEQIRFSGEGVANGSGQDQNLKCNYIEAFEEFVSLACDTSCSFFGAAKEEKPPIAKKAAAIGKKETRRAVV